MTLKEAKQVVKSVYPRAFCKTIHEYSPEGESVIVVASRRGYHPIGDKISALTPGAVRKAWVSAAGATWIKGEES